MANAGRSAMTRFTRGSRASISRSALLISATCAACQRILREATPCAAVTARTSGEPWNSTMTLDRPQSC
jgi:hypothetical protein